MSWADYIGNLFGFTIKKTKEEEERQNAESFVAPTNEDGAYTVEAAGGLQGTYIDFDGSIKDEFELITRYREMAQFPEVDSAIDDIVNESIVMDGTEPPVKLNLSDVEIDESVKEKINEAFKRICRLLKWNKKAYSIFRHWYVDGRLYYHIVLPNNYQVIDGNSKNAKTKAGILELRYIDPRQIRKIREVNRDLDNSGVEITKVVNEYYIYNQRGIKYQGAGTMLSSVAQGISGARISTDAVVYIHSDIPDKFNSIILSNLHKAIKPLNQLKMMKDALVIYRIVRAPERRMFIIDTGTLPKIKSDDYVRSLMAKHRNKMIYDSATGEMKDDRKHLAMIEDYWIPVRDGGVGTKIETLKGGENLGEVRDIEVFQKDLYVALNVPFSRLQQQGGGIPVGRTTEIRRDEDKFSKMIHRFRLQFSQLFNSLLETELVLTGVMTRDDWSEIAEDVKYAYAEDNHFAELIENEMLRGRLELLAMVDPTAENYTKKYFSVEWVKEHILKQSEDDQKEEEKRISKEETKYAHLEPELVTNVDDPQFGDQPAPVKTDKPGKPAKSKSKDK